MKNNLYHLAYIHSLKRHKTTKSGFKRLLHTTYKEQRGENNTYRKYLLSSNRTQWHRYKESRLQRVRSCNILTANNKKFY